MTVSKTAFGEETVRKLCLLTFTLSATVAPALIPARPVFAIKQFKAEFDKKYNVTAPTNESEKALAEKVSAAQCNVCHEGPSKKKRNAYGQALDVYLDRKLDTYDMEKIQDALKKVESEHSKKGDDKSPTFGELIKMGKLPGDANP